MTEAANIKIDSSYKSGGGGGSSPGSGVGQDPRYHRAAQTLPRPGLPQLEQSALGASRGAHRAGVLTQRSALSKNILSREKYLTLQVCTDLAPAPGDPRPVLLSHLVAGEVAGVDQLPAEVEVHELGAVLTHHHHHHHHHHYDGHLTHDAAAESAVVLPPRDVEGAGAARAELHQALVCQHQTVQSKLILAMMLSDRCLYLSR